MPLSAALAAAPASAGAADLSALAKGLGGGKAPINSALTGAVAPNALQASRFILTGVVVQKSSQQGVALIAVDGKPARPYRVGSALADGVVLQGVSNGKAMLSASAQAATELTLELPRLITALVGNATAARPNQPIQPGMPQPNLAANLPSPMPAIISISSVQAQQAAAAAAMTATAQANSSTVPAGKPPRPLANRLREAGQDAARDPSGSPAQ
jgi:general secretion pathway protein C